jgi:hypothetical protein
MYGAVAGVRNLLDAQDVKVFYFNNRTDANAYFSSNPDYGSAFTTSTARCANTYATKTMFAHRIAIAIYANCSYASSNPINPDYPKVTSHEKGHAFALALGKSQGRLAGPDRSSGYATRSSPSSLAEYDRTTLNTIAATCTIFSTYIPSALERDLGAPNDAVCASSTGPVIGQYVGKTNRQIADIRAPYFVNPPSSELYADLWAEQFSIFDSSVGGGTNVLLVTDEIVKQNRMRCTIFVVQSFYNTLLPVGPNNPNAGFRNFPVAWGCPAVTEAQQWQ